MGRRRESMNVIIKFLLTVLALMVSSIPLWMYMGGRSLVSPEGFLQEFFVFGIGLWFLGGAQVVLWVFAGIVLLLIWR